MRQTRWSIWPDVAVRSAGLPVDLIEQLVGAEIDEKSPHSSSARQVVRSLLSTPAVLAAIAWQNPPIVKNWMGRARTDDKVLSSNTGRKRMSIAARYLQRYVMKNDTTGLTGPVGWARIMPDVETSAQRSGPRWSHRTIAFENWAIDAVARRIEAAPQVRRWLRPRLAANLHTSGGAVSGATGAIHSFDDDVLRAINLCNGTTALCDISFEAQQLIEQLIREGIIDLTFPRPYVLHPELDLLQQLQIIGDTEALKWAESEIHRLVESRDRLRGVADDPDRLLEALEALEATFSTFTDMEGHRRDGQLYAGRTIVYNDAARGSTTTLGKDFLDPLVPSLDVILTSSRWLVEQIGHEYRGALRTLFDAMCAERNVTSVSLASLAARASLLFVVDADPAPLRAAIEKFQERWSAVVEVDGDSNVDIDVGAIADAVRDAFPIGAAPWPGAVYACPDLMVAANGELAPGVKGLVVLGELHLAVNTLEARVFVDQHPNPDSLVRQAERDFRGTRHYFVPSRSRPQVNSRVYPSGLLSPNYHYWTMASDHTGAPAPVTPASAVRVGIETGGALVAHFPGKGDPIPLLSIFGEQLSAVAANAFKPWAPSRHMPRVTIGRIVARRESWRVAATEFEVHGSGTWQHRLDMVERERLALGIPREAFYRVTTEAKPLYVDFAAPLLVENLVQLLRRQVRQDPSGMVTFSELLPRREDAWLYDDDGRAVMSELRLVTVNDGAGTVQMDSV